MTVRTLVLASASPRRSELLARMGFTFAVDAPNVDEHVDGGARDVVRLLAQRKADAVAARLPEATVLAADTVVDCGGVLGKPVDEADAARMLRLLSGRWHEVHTGVCVIRDGLHFEGVETTRVHFTAMSDHDISRYIATGDPFDKAGAYAIQGMTGMFIDRIEGCPHNVMGLPLALTRKLLFE